MTREPEWDDHSRARALALVAWEERRCPSCGNFESLVPLPRDTRHVTWSENDGRVVEVLQFRCLACGAADLIKRDWSKRHEKDQPIAGQALPADGRVFIAQPLNEQEEEDDG